MHLICLRVALREIQEHYVGRQWHRLAGFRGQKYHYIAFGEIDWVLGVIAMRYQAINFACRC